MPADMVLNAYLVHAAGLLDPLAGSSRGQVHMVNRPDLVHAAVERIAEVWMVEMQER
jgi:hypothetical protein